MPLLGLIPFLPSTNRWLMMKVGLCVNALTRAYPISTAFLSAVEVGKKCQCPYSGLSHFYDYSRFTVSIGVSMPLLGLIPFLHEFMSNNTNVTLRCQCPYSGLSHFYRNYVEKIEKNFFCVNALTRAYPISTSVQSMFRF